MIACQNMYYFKSFGRLGGRMQTVHFGNDADSIVEMGANWIHGGSLTNSVYALASDFGLMKDAPILNR